MTALLVWVLVASGTSVDAQAVIGDVLRDGAATSVDCQREVGVLLGWRAESASGVIVTGRGASVTDLAPDEAQQELPDHPDVTAYFETDAEGPEPMRALVPYPGGATRLAAYRRVEKGLYVRLRGQLQPVGDHVSIEVQRPGRYLVLAESPESPSPGVKAFFDFAFPSSDHVAKGAWEFYRVAPDRIAGDIPVVLLHGMGGDRWGEFIHWATYSDEAAPFREAFQLWNYRHPASGVNAPIGFSPEYPAFDESIVAYLDRFISDAEENGVESAGVRYYFPDGPYMLVGHSLGGLKILAFLSNFPGHAERVRAAVSLSGPLTGSPWAIPEWQRHTFLRMGPCLNGPLRIVLKGIIPNVFLRGYMNTGRQSDLDAGWGNFDAAGGFGIPTTEFRAWRYGHGIEHRMLSPRDANQSGARLLPGYDDRTFEPGELLGTYCGGMEHVVPAQRGDSFTGKLFLYGAYLDRLPRWTRARTLALKAAQDPSLQPVLENRIEQIGLTLAQIVMAQVASEGTDSPLGAYALGDGFVPIQSQLMLDGEETELLYETRLRRGWRVPVLPYRHRQDVIEAHTLADPEHVRVLPGWSHVDTVTGRYDPESGHSELFVRVRDDLLSALP